MNSDIEKLLEDRYFLEKETKWEQLAKRVSGIYEPVYELIRDCSFIPSSPTLMNANTKGECIGTLSSCFPMGVIKDSIDGIFDAVKEAAKVTKLGGGVGFSFSSLRGSNEVIKSLNRNSSGPLPFINVFNSTLDSIRQAGKRRGAGMALLNIHRENIINFIMAKRTLTEFNRFNFSIEMTNKFYDQLLNNPNAPHQIQNVITGEWQDFKSANGDIITVQQIWDLIAESAYICAEPGLFNIDIAWERFPCKNISDIVLCNPCSEHVHAPYSSCCLASINYSSLVENKRFNWEKFEQIIIHGVRFLNNVIDQNLYPLPTIKDVTLQTRPIGLGFMGLAHALYLKQIPYASSKGIKFIEDTTRYLTLRAMVESVDLAKQHGPYPSFDYDIFMTANERFFDSQEFKNIDIEKLKKDIKKYGIRNSALTAVAPTGTLSTIAECSSGIEPVFGLIYRRKVEQLNKEYDIMYTQDKIFQKYLDNNFNEEQIKKILEHVANNKGSCQTCDLIPEDMKKIFVTAGDLTPIEHVNTLEAASKWISMNVSKTINLPTTASQQEIQQIYLEAYKKKIIGITVYRDKSREGILIHKDEINTKLPKRPKSLQCNVYKITVSGEKWIIFIGIMNEKPFEIFAGKINLVDIPSNISDGIIIKTANGYEFEHNGETLIKDITTIFENEAHEALTRMISIALQSGTGVAEIVRQLNKSKGTIADFSKSILRALKKYVRDGEKAESLCPNCGEPLIYYGGCIECINHCGYSVCG